MSVLLSSALQRLRQVLPQRLKPLFALAPNAPLKRCSTLKDPPHTEEGLECAERYMIPIRDTPSGATFQIKVQPRAQEERHHRRDRRRPEDRAHRASARRPRQPGLHCVLRRAFECFPLVNYHCRRRNQPQQADSRERALGRRGRGEAARGVYVIRVERRWVEHAFRSLRQRNFSRAEVLDNEFGLSP